MSELPAFEDLVCPNCGHTDSFLITAESEFLIDADGAGANKDVIYAGNSPATCPMCDWSGVVADLAVKDQVLRLACALLDQEEGILDEAYTLLLDLLPEAQAEAIRSRVCRSTVDRRFRLTGGGSAALHKILEESRKCHS